PSDEQVLDVAFAARNGSRVRDLWEGGSDGDESSTDLALISCLSFYTQEEAQLERLWLSSQRGARAKVQRRRDYRTRTISKALAGRREKFDWDRWARRQGEDAKPRMTRTALPPPPPEPDPPRELPPGDSVHELWDQCSPVRDDPLACAWFHQRWPQGGVQLLQWCSEADAVRVLPRGVKCPSWARFGEPWSETPYRLIVPQWGSQGALASLRARWISQELPPYDRKSVAPKGHTVAGAVMASGVGRAILQLGAVPPWATDNPLVIWILEGEPDYLACAGLFDHEDDDAPVVFGIVSGSWTAEIAARIPDGVSVVLATDGDTAGEHYAKSIRATLKGRNLKVRRYRGKGCGHGD
ncbi:toprim domain-containing protein, partial [Myxococcota bacterium]